MNVHRLVLAAALGVAGCASSQQVVKTAEQLAEEAKKIAAEAKAAADAQRRAEEEKLNTPDAEFRAAKPASGASRSAWVAPVPVERKLKSGARLLVVENHAVPLVAVELLIGTGSDGETIDKAGLADFTASMLREGTKTRTSLQLAEQLDDLAARLSGGAMSETSRLRLNCLKETLPASLDLMVDVLLNPAFRAEDLERVRGLLLTQLVQKKANPGALARDEQSRIFWGDKHPWGQPEGGTPATVKSITAADLGKFHQTWYRPNNAIIAVSGDVSADEIQKLLDARLTAWKAKALPKRALPAPPDLGARAITLVDKPGASQSQVWVFGRGISIKDPDLDALRVANYILGGLFGSRLNMNLREAKGYSYGVRSSVAAMRDHGMLVAAGGIKANVTAEALVEYEKELKEFAGGALREGELDKAREAAIRSLPSQLETNDAVAGSIASIAFNGLPLDYYKTLPDRIGKVDAAAVARVAAKYILPDKWPVVIVGPRADSEEKLKALGLGAVTVRADVK